ncbi:MAG: GntR family transcriptional regulator [Cyclobacteriaceae bacterium]|nr:GntR family transcriptional regulator [Cyclobacteriaceae bacterium]
MTIQIDQFSETPKYVQIHESIINSIKSGEINKGSKLPSINQICSENKLARETVIKAFNQLKEKGLVASVHGKGFYVASTNTRITNRVFLLFDTFSSYKETLFHAINSAFGKGTSLDIYFHHFNYEVFKNTIATHIGNYTSYIILPFDHKRISSAIAPIPKEKLYLLDRKPENLNSNYCGIYQDFENDVKETLSSIDKQIRKYKSLKLIFRNTITNPPKELEMGFKVYCAEHNIKHEVSYEKVTTDIKKLDAYIVIDDDDLVRLVELSQLRGYKIGKDIGIISYNDTPLKKVVGNGISVISTDFKQMGKEIVEMINENSRSAKRNKTTFVNRGSF